MINKNVSVEEEMVPCPWVKLRGPHSTSHSRAFPASTHETVAVVFIAVALKNKGLGQFGITSTVTSSM